MSDENLPSVIYRGAFAWTCLDCGKTNFHEGEVSENPDHHAQHLEEFKAQFPDQDWDNIEGEFVHMPSIVTCAHCSKRFRTAHTMGPENEDAPEFDSGAPD